MNDELIYGVHAVAAALTHQAAQVSGLWVEPEPHKQRIQLLLAQAAQCGIAVHLTTRNELERMSGGARHQGVIARVRVCQSRYREADLANLLANATEPPLLLVLDGVQDPHNFGACLRSAAAAGVHALLVPADRAVGLTATVRKVACGAAEIVPVITVTNLARVLRSLQEQGVWIVGAAGEAAESLYAMDFTPPTAIVLGGEEKGLRHLTRQICDCLARIPMLENTVASLNVSVATGIFLFEAQRQRCA